MAMKFSRAGIAMMGLGLLLATAARADQWSKTYTVSGKPVIHLTVSDGNIQIARGGAGSVMVRVDSSHINVSSDAHISESQSGNNIDISIRSSAMHWFHIGGGSAVTVTVTVPSNADLNMSSGDGSISASQISGQIELNSGDGSLDINHLGGTLRLHTGDGSINARDLDGNLDADTGDGTVTLQGRLDGVKARSGDGDIRVEAAANSQPGSSGWELKSGDGNLSLRVPGGFRANLEARTGDGRITVDFPVTVSGSFDEKSMSAKINGGGPTVTMITGDGSIRVEHQ